MQALTQLITAGNYTIQDNSSSNAVNFGTLSIQGGNVVASPKETGSGYVYELNTVMLGASADKAAPLTGTPNFAVSFKDGGNTHPISLESYRFAKMDHLFSDVSNPAAPQVNTTLLTNLGGISNGSVSIDVGSTLTVAKAAALNSATVGSSNPLVNYSISDGFANIATASTRDIALASRVESTGDASGQSPEMQQLIAFRTTDQSDDSILSQVQANSAATGNISLSGQVQEGATLTITENTAISDKDGTVTKTYQWLRGDTNDPSAAAPINGATSASYTIDPAGADNGKFIFGRVTATDPAGGETRFTAVSSGKVAAVNDLPTGADSTISINEDNVHVFSLNDFGFQDEEDR